MNYKKFIVVLGFLAVLVVYLFVSAPPQLQATTVAQIPIQKILELCEYENSIVRKLYTVEIVGQGKKRGLKFDENWNDDNSKAGPLPAQFLRLTSIALEKSKVRIGLYLGSDFAINKANSFTGEQKNVFMQVKKNNQAHFFYVKDIDHFAYMFPDIAVAQACLDCHNKHPDSPKDNWRLNDIMGATTWTFPTQNVDLKSAIQILSSLRSAVGSAYAIYLQQVQKLAKPPQIGDRWPREGFFIPDSKTFAARVSELASPRSLKTLFELANNKSIDHDSKNSIL